MLQELKPDSGQKPDKSAIATAKKLLKDNETLYKDSRVVKEKMRFAKNVFLLSRSMEQAGEGDSTCLATLKVANQVLSGLGKGDPVAIEKSLDSIKKVKSASEAQELYYDTIVGWISTNKISIETLGLEEDESKSIIAKLLEKAQNNMLAAGVTCSIEGGKIRATVTDEESLSALETNVFAHLGGLSDTTLEIDFVAPSFGEGINALSQFIETHGDSIHSLDLSSYRNKIDAQIAEKLIKNCRKLNHLFVSSDKIKQLPDLSGLTSLQTLDLRYCEALEQLSLSGLTRLQTLNLSYCIALKELPDLSGLTRLQTLNLSCYGALKQLPDLSGLTRLQKLDLSYCIALKELPDLSGLTSLQTLNLSCCIALKELSDLSGLTRLQKLDLSRCEALEQLPDLSGLTSLQTLNLSCCEALKELSLSGLTSLQTLNLFGCKTLKELSLSGLTSLQTLNLGRCEALGSSCPI